MNGVCFPCLVQVTEEQKFNQSQGTSHLRGLQKKDSAGFTLAAPNHAGLPWKPSLGPALGLSQDPGQEGTEPAKGRFSPEYISFVSQDPSET